MNLDSCRILFTVGSVERMDLKLSAPDTKKRGARHFTDGIRGEMPSNDRTATISFKVTPRLKTELEVEAWECGEKLGEYIRGLLERRGKWARSVGRGPGNYDIAMPLRTKE